MPQPGEKLNQVSTHSGSFKNTLGKIVNGVEDMVTFRFKGRITVDDRKNRRGRSTTKMLIPSCGADEKVTGLEDCFGQLRLVKPFD